MHPCSVPPSAFAGITFSIFWSVRVGAGVTCARACELALKTWGVGMQGKPGGLSTPRPPCPLFLPSLATHTPAAQNQEVRSGAGGGAACGPDSQAGGREHWLRSVEGALGALTPQRRRESGEASGAGGLEPRSPHRSLQSCLKPQLPLQSLLLPLQSPPAMLPCVGQG